MPMARYVQWFPGGPTGAGIEAVDRRHPPRPLCTTARSRFPDLSGITTTKSHLPTFSAIGHTSTRVINHLTHRLLPMETRMMKATLRVHLQVYGFTHSAARGTMSHV
jgi:hypothetical protein